MKSLLIGAGRSREKKVRFTSAPTWTGELVTVDMDPNCGADVVYDLEKRPLPFGDAEFDEIHAYDCLEHWGRQGDWRAWFDEMAEYHRILKPGGKFFALVPVGEDRFADPGHTRFFSLNSFLFLDQRWYLEGVDNRTDYRWYWKKDFRVLDASSASDHLAVVLEKA